MVQCGFWKPWERGLSASAINNDGLVVGLATIQGNQYRAAVLWKNGAIVELGIDDNLAAAEAINAKGQIAAWSWHGADSEAYRWTDGAVQILEAPGNLRRYAYGINDAGQVVGYVQTTPITEERPVLWERDGALIELDLPDGFTEGRATAINNAGQIVGTAWKADEPRTRVRCYGTKENLTISTPCLFLAVAFTCPRPFGSTIGARSSPTAPMAAPTCCRP